MSNQRLRTDNSYNLPHYNIKETEGIFEMPTLKGVDFQPTKLTGFNYALTSKNTECGIHFYLDDYQFERVWTYPERYAEILKKYECVLTPDFSLYFDMSMANKIWNTYRSRLIGQIFQNYGLTVIPTVSWAEPDTFHFCFDGLPCEATLSVSTIGVKRTKEVKELWKYGMDELIKRKKPKKLIVYGGNIEYDYKNTEVVFYKNEITEKFDNMKR